MNKRSQQILNLKPESWLVLLLTVTLMLPLVSACGGRSGATSEGASPVDSVSSDSIGPTLRVAAVYGPTSYFIYRDLTMGYDYSLITALAAEHGKNVQITVAASVPEAVKMLERDSVDIVCSRVPVTAEYVKRVNYCGPSVSTTQVLVQRREPSDSLITDVTQLPGRDVYVTENTKYHQRLRNLDSELGGGINIHTFATDSLGVEDLIDMVSDHKIDLTVVDSDVARLNHTYYPDLDITLEMSFSQNARWAVSKDRPWLADSIDAWMGGEEPRRENDILLRRYFELAKSSPNIATYRFKNGQISASDALFKKYAGEIGWDWRLLASQAFVESRFDNSVVSWAGARGIMQIMPSTALAYNVKPSELTDNEVSVRTCVRILAELDKTFKPLVKDPQERLLFILAAYNSGHAHIYDAIALARKYGYDAAKWKDNVAEALLLKSQARYYNDPVCKYGYFRGRQTVKYVEEVMSFYERARRAVKK